MKMLELKYPIGPDEHGVIDGMALATALMRSAADALLPYVGHCPACLYVAFKNVADELFGDMSGTLRDGSEDALILTPGLTGVARQNAIAVHLLNTRNAMLAMENLGPIEDCCHEP